MVEPEPDRRRVVARRCRRRFLRPGRFARDQHEHLALGVVAQAHLGHLPLGLAWLQAPDGGLLALDLDALRVHHLVQPHDQGLDLRLLAGQCQRPALARSHEEELAVTGLSDRRQGDRLDRVELVDHSTSSLRVERGSYGF